MSTFVPKAILTRPPKAADKQEAITPVTKTPGNTGKKGKQDEKK